MWHVARIGIAVLIALSVGDPAWAQEQKARLPEPQLYALYCWSEGYVKFADDVDKVGIRWLRCGGWTRESADKAALLAAKRGVHLVPVLGMKEMSHGKTMPLDEALKQWREQVRSAVKRYGPEGDLWKENKGAPALPIRCWEIWNEPNIEFLTPPEGMLRTELYAKLLTAASAEIRQLDPGATIIAFNTAGGNPDRGRALKPDGMFEKLKYIGWRKFIRDSATLAGTTCFDAVGTHPYCQPSSPEVGGVAEGVEMTREVARELKFGEKPIWFTEVGWPLEYPNNKQVRDERQQACFVVRLFAIAAAHGVTQVQIMYIEDIIYGPDGSRRSFGFFTGPGKWREQATATEVMIDLLPDPRKGARILAEESGDEGPGVFAYEFNGVNGWRIIVAWDVAEGPVEREFQVAGKDVTLVDMLGKTESLQPEGGKVKVKLGEAPVYLVPAPKTEVDKIINDVGAN